MTDWHTQKGWVWWNIELPTQWDDKNQMYHVSSLGVIDFKIWRKSRRFSENHDKLFKPCRFRRHGYIRRDARRRQYWFFFYFRVLLWKCSCILWVILFLNHVRWYQSLSKLSSQLTWSRRRMKSYQRINAIMSDFFIERTQQTRC